jgi:2-polyprenyl-6-hydroxyphenyl methylase / 3-demethylubiquinone-9 3-methyltransferase
MRGGFEQINNDVYKQAGDIWWDENAPLNLLQTAVNPVRVGYFHRLIQQELRLPVTDLSAVEVGCGGGLLCEEIARMGFGSITGIDPSEEALAVARAHALRSNLAINYVSGAGELLPVATASKDVVFCCDVLEHVRDLRQVLEEIARVLKPGGHFFYDTLNRTRFSHLVAIKLWQDWELFSFMPKDLHVWEMFIKPEELREHFAAVGFENLALTGIAPAANPLIMLYQMRQMKRGKLSLREMGQRLRLCESRDLRILYAGCARRFPL